MGGFRSISWQETVSRGGRNKTVLGTKGVVRHASDCCCHGRGTFVLLGPAFFCVTPPSLLLVWGIPSPPLRRFHIGACMPY